MSSRPRELIALVAGLLLALCASACRSTQAAAPQLGFEIAMVFDGAQAIDAADLQDVVRAELVRLEVARPDRAALDDAAFALELFYRARGFADVHVDYALEETPGAAPRARFTITEGPRVRVRALTIEGPSQLGLAHARSFFGPAAAGRAYDAERLASSVDALREDYLGRGYLRVAIDEPRVERVATDEVTIAIAIEEGPAFFVRAVNFEGGVPELARREAGLAGKYVGKKFLNGVEREIEDVLREDYRHGGYPDVALATRTTLDEANGDVRLDVAVTPGERVTIAAFRIIGNLRTRDAAILSTMKIAPGARYDSEEVRRAFHDLYATGLFEKVELELEGRGPERTLKVALVEARSVQVRVEPGFGSYEGPRLLIGIAENNFRGLGQVLSLEGTVSARSQKGKLGLLDRDFFGSHWAAETTFYVEHRVEPSFEYVRRGYSFFLRHALGRYWSTSLGYEYRPTNVSENLQSVPLDLLDDANVAELSTSLSLDDRDNPLLPRSGRRGRLRLEWADDALGSKVEFVRAQLDFSQLFHAGEGVIAVAARSGVMSPFGATTVIPLPERFFNGGENSVRSFKEDELGPHDLSNQPLGGESATTLSLEYRHPLAGSLDGALFVDAGNVTEQVGDYLRFPDFRFGVGVGLRYLLPIGPLRIDLGVNPDAQTDPTSNEKEDEFVLHFSVGFPF